MSNDTLREELKRLDKAATPGPWQADLAKDHPFAAPSLVGIAGMFWGTHPPRDPDAEAAMIAQVEANANLIALLRNAVPQMLAMMDELEDWRESARKVMAGECAKDERHCACVPAILATNHAQAEEIEKLKEELEEIGRHLDVQIGDTQNARADAERLSAALATVTQERDARTQEAAQAQARVSHYLAQFERIAMWLSEVSKDPQVLQVKEWIKDLLYQRPTGTALEAVVQRAREEEREKVEASFLVYGEMKAMGGDGWYAGLVGIESPEGAKALPVGTKFYYRSPR